LEFQKQKKEEFLYIFLDLIENNSFEKGLVVMICSNNIHSIFEGVDMTHFRSLKNRLIPVEFESCDSEQFSEYIRFYNDSMTGTRFHYEPERLTRAIEMIDPCLSITYRSISHCQIQSQFDIDRWVARVNNVCEASSSEEHTESEDLQTQESPSDVDFGSESESEASSIEEDEDSVKSPKKRTVAKTPPAKKQPAKKPSKKLSTGACRKCTFFHQGKCTYPPCDYHPLVKEIRERIDIISKTSTPLNRIPLVIQLFQYISGNENEFSSVLRSSVKFLRTVDGKISELKQEIKDYLERSSVPSEEKSQIKYDYDAAIVIPQQCLFQAKGYLKGEGVKVDEIPA
jgi:hypothetical protein